jgi:glucokinase
MHVVAGDIGGTSARLALYDVSGQMPRLIARRTYASRDHAGVEPVLVAFMAEAGMRPDAIALGVAGPVREGVCRTTNLPWVIAVDAVSAATGVQRVRLINDLEAAAWGVDTVEDDQRVVLHAGSTGVRANQSVIAAGTGFGEAGRVWTGDRYLPFASEGGHADFAPTDEIGYAFHRWMAQRHGHVSWDRVVSGSGLVSLHDFLRDRTGGRAPDWLAHDLASGDPAAAIARAGLERTDAVCDEALGRFVRLFGAEAGNHALKLMALGGVYITGGIAPKILPRLKEGAFVEAFLDKGRMRPVVADMPVTVILDGDVALKGAALCASDRPAAPRRLG